MHSLDILAIELLSIIFWINPLLLLYKKAVQLNHEFLADDGVVSKYNDVKAYQNLLLTKISSNNSIPLTTNFNFLFTKKRLIMMTKHPKPIRAGVKQLVLLPFLAVAVSAFTTKIVRVVEKPKVISQQASRPERPEVERANPSIAKPTLRQAESSLKTSNRTELTDDKKPLTFVEVMPGSPGGIENFKSFIVERIDSKITEGTYSFSFVVEKNGSVVSPLETKLYRSTIENQVVEALKQSPRWSVGIQNGYPIAIDYTMTLKIAKVDDRRLVTVEELHAVSKEFSVSLEKRDQQGQVSISGTILDHDGNPIPRVSIFTKDYKFKAVADKDGKFSFELPDARPVIFSHIGYTTKNDYALNKTNFRGLQK